MRRVRSLPPAASAQANRPMTFPRQTARSSPSRTGVWGGSTFRAEEHGQPDVRIPLHSPANLLVARAENFGH